MNAYARKHARMSERAHKHTGHIWRIPAAYIYIYIQIIICCYTYSAPSRAPSPLYTSLPREYYSLLLLFTTLEARVMKRVQILKKLQSKYTKLYSKYTGADFPILKNLYSKYTKLQSKYIKVYSKYTGADFPEVSTRIFTILSFQNFGQGFVASWPIFYIYFKCTRALTFQNFCQGFVASWPRQCLRLIRERERSRPR